MAAKKSICDMINLSVQRSTFSFFIKLIFSHVIPLYLEKYGLIFTQLDRGPPGLSTKQSLATTVEENCYSNLVKVKGPKMLR